MPYYNIRRPWKNPDGALDWEAKLFYATDATEAHALAAREPRAAKGWEDAESTIDVSEDALKILGNFSGISNRVVLDEGRRQAVAMSGLLAVAELPWPKNTVIYDLNQFVRAVSDFTTPTIEFQNGRMVVTEPTSTDTLRYHYADPEQKSLPHDNPAVEFTLSEGHMKAVKRATILDVPSIVVSVDKGQVFFEGLDPKNPKSHTFSRDIPPENTTVHDPTFSRTFRFPIPHITRLLDGAYTVKLADWPYGVFAHQTIPIAYYISAESALAPQGGSATNEDYGVHDNE
jgi:hypothetical protein